nr:MAG TPA: hypothetical protein [Caudoviricetes sp.]
MYKYTPWNTKTYYKGLDVRNYYKISNWLLINTLTLLLVYSYIYATKK